MDKKNLDVSKIEIAIRDYIKSHTEYTSGVWAGRRNRTSNDSRMIYCVCPVDVLDKNAIGSTLLRIEIYVKKVSGYKNYNALTPIHDKLIDLIDNGLIIDNYYFDFMGEISGEDDAGYDYLFLNLNVVID